MSDAATRVEQILMRVQVALRNLAPFGNRAFVSNASDVKMLMSPDRRPLLALSSICLMGLDAVPRVLEPSFLNSSFL